MLKNDEKIIEIKIETINLNMDIINKKGFSEKISTKKNNNNTLIDIIVADEGIAKERFHEFYILRDYMTNKNEYLLGKLTQFSKEKSISKYYSSAIWIEREIFDMYGIIYENNKDLRRILNDYFFKGFPLRKDFAVYGYLISKYCVKIKALIVDNSILRQEFVYR